MAQWLRPSLESAGVQVCTVPRYAAFCLQQAGLLKSRKEGRWVYYRLAPPAEIEAIFQWLDKSVEASEQMTADFQALERIVGIGREDLCRMQRGEECCPKR